MAFYKQDIVDINLNTGSIFRSFLNHSIGFKNDDADRFGIRCFRDGEPVDLSGASCQAVFMAPNGVNIALTSYGTVSGNVAYVTLPPACYDYEGQFCLSIQLVGGGVTGTMRIVDGMVVNTGASGAVAPTASVPTYQEIISQYNAMVAATSAANLAIAETFDATKAYPAGKYVINDGHLYRLTADHAANVTWANTSKVTTNFGDDLSSLKSALSVLFVEEKNVLQGLNYEAGKMYDVNNSGFNKSTAPSNGWIAYDVVNIEAGKTYYYCYMRPYFSKIIYDNGGGSYRVSDSDSDRYGSFTATYNGRVGLTSSAQNYALFTDDENTYNKYIRETKNKLNESIDLPQLDAVLNDKNYFMNRINILEDLPTVINKGYDRGSTVLIDNNALAAITEPVYLSPGVTYYYRNIWAYFTQFRTGDGSVIEITDNTEGMASGSFTPSVGGYLYVSLNKLSVAEYTPISNQDHVNKYLLTTSKEMYEDNVWHTQNRNYEFHVGANYEYTNLVRAIIEANKYMDSVVYVHDGEHDFIDEISDVFGSDYIESVDGSHRGVYLKNRIHLIFASGASVVCNYTGSTQSVRQWLAVFNAGQHGFTIENATIKGSNLRYIIHDERDQDIDQYTNKYINCKMYFDNSANTDWNGNNCIGGGLGRNGHIVVDGCYFESVRRSGQSATGENARGIVTYHNSAGSGKNGIDIHDSYIANVGTVRVTWYGSSPATQKTVAMVSGCSLGSEIITRAEDSSATIENVEVIDWNNEVRVQ